MNSGIIIIAVSILWVGSEIILARTKRSQAVDMQCDKSSLRILWITIAIAVNVGILLSIQRVGHIENGSPILAIAGLIFIVFGLLVRWIAILSLKRQFTVDVSITEEHHLVRKGIYAHVRHPAYAGSLLSFLGLALCTSNYLSMLIIFVPICLAFLYRIRIEEEALVHAFGNQYLDYRASTRRFIPGVI